MKLVVLTRGCPETSGDPSAVHPFARLGSRFTRLPTGHWPFQQRIGPNILYLHSVHAQLSSLDGGDVATGATTDDKDVSLGGRKSRQRLLQNSVAVESQHG